MPSKPSLDPVVHHRVAADVQARRGRHRAADVVAQHGGEPVDVRGHAGVGEAAHQLARPGVLLAAGPVLPLGGQVLPHAGAGPLQRAVHGVDGVPEEFRDVLRRPAEHVPQDQHGPRARREVLDRDQVRQLDRLPRDGDGLRLVRVVRGQLVEQPVRVGLQPQHLAAGRGLRAALGEQVQAGVGGDPVQPGPERRPPLEGLPPPPGTQERLLHGVLGVLERPEHPVAVHVQLPPVPLRQPRERRLVDLAQTAHAQLLQSRVRTHRVILPSRRVPS